MTNHPRAAFQEKVFTLPLSSIVPQHPISAETKSSKVYRQIKASVKEIGLIEPLVVFPQNDRNFLLLDGHVRFAILIELGASEAKSLIANDDEAFTYNKRVNFIPPIAQHLMLLQALNRGVSEERIAAALNVEVASVRKKARMLDGICDEVVELLRDRKLNPELFRVLRKMKPAIQIATAELMVLRNDLSVSFAKTRLALTPPDLLISPPSRKPKIQAESVAAQMLLEDDTETLVRNLKTVEASYGTDVLTLTVGCTYIQRLFESQRVVRYMERNHAGLLGALQVLVSDVQAPQRKASSA
jgi:prepilin-type processing-associated H-X9-DG protein